MDKRQLLKCSPTWLSFILVLVSTVSSMGPLKPMPIEYAITRLTQRQKEQFVDEHNECRSLANPPAANMEYMVRTWFLFSLFVISYAWCHKQIIKFKGIIYLWHIFHSNRMRCLFSHSLSIIVVHIQWRCFDRVDRVQGDFSTQVQWWKFKLIFNSWFDSVEN